MRNPGAIAQLGERLLCKQEVTGSIPVGSTSHPSMPAAKRETCACVWQQVLYRLFFKNSDEVNRVRFERTVLTGYEIA